MASMARTVEVWWEEVIGRPVPDPYSIEYQDMIDQYLNAFDPNTPSDEYDPWDTHWEPTQAWSGDGYDYTYAPTEAVGYGRRKSNKSVMTGQP